MDDSKSYLNENVRICIQSWQILPTAEDGYSQNDRIGNDRFQTGQAKNAWIKNNKTETNQMETVIFGRHYYRGGKHYLLYEELLEGLDRPTACRMKISSDTMEMTRQGNVRTILTFEKGQIHKSNYHTPYGVISLETETTHFHLDEQTDSLEVETKYTLAMDGQPVSENQLRIEVYNC